jgi:hypothetical protein
VGADPQIAAHLTVADLDEAFNIRHHLRWGSVIIDRALRDVDG